MSTQQMNNKSNSPKETHPFLARLFFNHQKLWLIVFAIATVFLAYHAAGVRPQAGFEKMVPLNHPYIQNFLANRSDVQGGNLIRVAVAAKEGDIFSDEYLEILHKVSNEIFFLPGVDRSSMKSLWTKNVQWRAITEEGFEGGIVIPDSYDGSPASIDEVRRNVLRSGQVGQLVANDFKSAIVLAPLLDTNPETGEALDYSEFSGKGKSMLFLVASGTAVKVEKIGE